MWNFFGKRVRREPAKAATLEEAVIDFLKPGSTGNWCARSGVEGAGYGEMGPIAWPPCLGTRTDVPNLRLMWRGHLIGFVESIDFPMVGVCRVGHLATARDVVVNLPPVNGKVRRGVGRKIVTLFALEMKARYGVAKIVFTETSQNNVKTADYPKFFASIGAVGCAMKPGATPQGSPVPYQWELPL